MMQNMLAGTNDEKNQFTYKRNAEDIKETDLSRKKPFEMPRQ